jgi:hypothetical protein
MNARTGTLHWFSRLKGIGQQRPDAGSADIAPSGAYTSPHGIERMPASCEVRGAVNHLSARGT